MTLTTASTVFYHLPRTGGTFVERVLDGLGLGKARGSNRAHESPLDDPERLYENRHAFTVLREPVTWIASWYRWVDARNGDVSGLGRSAILANSYFKVVHEKSNVRFARFIEEYLNRSPGLLTVVFNDYANKCDTVLHAEDLASELCEMLNENAAPFDPSFVLSYPRVNTSTPERCERCQWPVELVGEFVRSERNIYENYYPEMLPLYRVWREAAEVLPSGRSVKWH